MTRRTSLSFAIIGALLLVGTPLSWSALQPPTEVGQVPTAPASPETAGDEAPAGGHDTKPRPHGAPDGDTGEAGRFLAGDPDISSASGARARDRGAATPTASGIALRGPIDPTIQPHHITIAEIGVAAPIVPVGLDRKGDMDIPRDVDTIGWYARGVVPGEPGSAVVTGHVDSRSQGPGAFFGLSRLDVDDRVVLTSAEGHDQQWRVVAREQRDRAEIPRDVVYARSGTPQLVLITCGGAFDRTARSYAENVIVYAELVEPNS